DVIPQLGRLQVVRDPGAVDGRDLWVEVRKLKRPLFPQKLRDRRVDAHFQIGQHLGKRLEPGELLATQREIEAGQRLVGEVLGAFARLLEACVLVEIGRASCRERVWMAVGGGSLKEKRR